MAPIPKSKLAKRKNYNNSKNISESPSSRKRQSSTTPQIHATTNKRNSKTQQQQQQEPDTQVVFEDPYGDDYEHEQLHSNSSSTPTNHIDNGVTEATKPMVFRPGMHEIAEGETLVCDETAYDIFYRCNVEWPALSFDFICTGTDGMYSNLLPAKLNAYPLSISLVLGTQAAKENENKLVFARMSNLHRNPKRKSIGNNKKPRNTINQHDNDDSDDDSDSDNEDDSDEEEEEDDDSEDEDDADGKDPITLAKIDVNAIMQNSEFKTDATVNRVRVMPQNSNIIAYWSERARVHIIDATTQLNTLYLDSTRARLSSSSSSSFSSKPTVHTIRSHAVEGYALDWSRVTPGRLLSGSIDGAVYLTEMTSNTTTSSFTTSTNRYRAPKASVEDIQWSVNEKDVFAYCTASPHPSIRIWDAREYKKPALSQLNPHGNNVDVNVLSWNRIETHLLASGGDDGVLKVWDLRQFSKNAMSSTVTAAAEFKFHSKPITAVQWHHTDSSMLLASSEDGAVSVWDLAVERDAEEEIRDGDVIDGANELPPQLLFLHLGQKNVKDAQWHPACHSLIVSTAEDGVHVFQPSNIALPA